MRHQRFAYIIAALCAVAGCMDTVVGPDPQQTTVRVSAMLRQSDNSREPLEGVDITVFSFPFNQDSIVARGRTNPQGIAELAMAVPPLGANYTVVASYNGQVQVKRPVLICNDTTFAFTFGSNVTTVNNCGVRTTADTVVFVDDAGSSQLVQNTPAGVRAYGQCWTAQFDPALGDITATIPSTLPAPFFIEAVYVDGVPVATSGEVAVPAGGSLAVCFSASTATVGRFRSPLDISIACAGASGSISVQLDADIVEPKCECPSTEIVNGGLTAPDRVIVGNQVDVSGVVFTNTLPCAVTITSASLTGARAAEWTIRTPSFPVVLQPGQSLNMTARFAPTAGGRSSAGLELRMQPSGGTTACDLSLSVEGIACQNSCPTLSTSGLLELPTMYVDTLEYRSDDRIPLSASTDRTEATARYTFTHSDTACESAQLTIRVSYPVDDATDRRYLTVSPSTLTLDPGESGSITVTFASPTPDEFAAIAARRRAGAAPSLKDSMFVVEMVVEGGGCRDVIRSVAVVSRCPSVATNLKVNGYAQQTSLIQTPLQEVFTFASLTKDRVPSSSPPNPYPPDRGDFYVDVDNNAPTNAPREPVLKLVPNSSFSRVGRWRQNYSNDRFENDACGATLTDFCATFDASVLGTGDIRNIQAGDVYVFEESSNVFGLIYVRETHNGTENNSNKQSSIEFAALYPVYCVD